MSNAWDINNVRKLAGLPLVESWDRDDMDDEDPDVKIAMGDKRQSEFEKKNKGELSAAQKAAAAKKTAAAKPVEKKPAPEAKKEEPKAEEKKEEVAAEAKRRGKAPNPESFNQHAKANARSMARGAFIKWAAEKHGKGKNYASSLFAKYNPKSSREVQTANEVWVIAHPHLTGFMLAENRELNQMQWVDPSSSLDPICFVTEAEAKKVQKYMSEWKSQSVVVEHIMFTDLTPMAVHGAAEDEPLEEKWKDEVDINPSKKGMFAGKSKAELESELAALKKSGPHKEGSSEFTKEKELNFALRAKSDWK